MSFKIEFTASAIKDLRSIPKLYQGKIINRAETLANNPFPRGSLKLRGLQEELWRIRVGSYRILY